MPHQCLNCGQTFADGSTDLLKGCPSCEGTRFFFTQEPLDETERAELKEQTDQDVHAMLRELVESGEKRNLSDDIWSREAWEEWVRLARKGETPTLEDIGDEDTLVIPHLDGDDGPDREAEPVERVKKSMQVRLEDVEELDAPEPDVEPEPGAGQGPEHEEVPGAEEAPVPQVQARPSTLNIVEPGNYEIDVERLMEDSPVIVERDGSYVIHLPSVFEKGRRKER